MERVDLVRHSMAHVLAAAVQEVFEGKIYFGIGPSIADGFYYDFDMEQKITPEDFEKIEQKMTEIIKRDLDFTKEVISRETALEMFKDCPYKTELINDLPMDAEISIYKLGDIFLDLCRGPHVENTRELRSVSFKLSRVSGAYWRGSEKNKMMQRVYAYCFLDKQELKAHLKMLEEAEKRDHRKLGKELELFAFSEFAPGAVIYMPNGMTIKNELIKYWREIHDKNDYLEIETPLIMNRKLWEISGHWEHYKENMYSFQIEGEDFAVKPMNCPGAMLYYKEKIHSYKDFPLRVCELGRVHRHESSGTLHGLLRVRSFVQDDAHIFLLKEQVSDEIRCILNMVKEMYSTFGLSYHLELSTMPEDHIGDVSDWEIAENSLKEALNSLGEEYVINEGDGAFYGPKIDIHIKDAIGKTWQCGTIQYDMQLPKRFNCEYVDKNGEKQEPIMLHRVIYGSLDRFLGNITEHFAGAFPLWLSPVQVKILPISDKFMDECEEIKKQLVSAGIRAKIDDRVEKIGYKIRALAKEKIPYGLIIGEEEINTNTVSVRMRGNKELKGVKLEDLISDLKDRILNRKLDDKIEE